MVAGQLGPAQEGGMDQRHRPGSDCHHLPDLNNLVNKLHNYLMISDWSIISSDQQSAEAVLADKELLKPNFKLMRREAKG